MGWYEGNSNDTTHPVGTKQPNAFGLYDMHGNVLEWCQDYWHDNYNGAPTDGSAWLSDGDLSHRVLRSGSWFLDAYNHRSAFRDWLTSDVELSTIGFRVVAVARSSPLRS
jgi:formylglycine-generating enzyme required for sulfatase activity